MKTNKQAMRERNLRAHLAEEQKYTLPLNSSSGYTLDRNQIAKKVIQTRKLYEEISKILDESYARK